MGSTASPEKCGFSEELLIYVHRFDYYERRCRCGRKTIDEPEYKHTHSAGFFGRPKKKKKEGTDNG